MSAVLAIGWNLTAGHLFPVVELGGERGTVPLTVPRMTVALLPQVLLRKAK